jgi:hypothetical protein
VKEVRSTEYGVRGTEPAAPARPRCYLASEPLRQALAGLSRDELIDVMAAAHWWSRALEDAIHDARVQAELRQYYQLCDAAQALTCDAICALGRANFAAASTQDDLAAASTAWADYRRLAAKRDRAQARADRAHARAMHRMDARHRQVSTAPTGGA